MVFIMRIKRVNTKYNQIQKRKFQISLMILHYLQDKSRSSASHGKLTQLTLLTPAPSISLSLFFFAIMHKVTQRSCTSIFVALCIHFCRHIPRSGVSGPQDGYMFNFIRNYQIVSQSVWTIGAPPATYERASCFIALPTLEVISHSILTLIN